MKSLPARFLLMISCLLASVALLAQSPLAIPYQGVARNASGEILASQALGLRISIRDVSASGTVVYQESHHPTTTSLGLFSLSIGGGTPIIGTLSAVNWGNGAKFIQVEMDATGGSSYTDMGTTQLNSVPYALYAQTAGSSGLAAGTAAGNTVYWNGSSWVTNNANIFNNGANVGIGTVAPANKLQVAGSIGIDGGKLPFYNTGESVFIGQNAGQGDDLANRQNVYLGYEAGKSNISGSLNTYVGHGAASASTGIWNTAIGQGAMNGIASGDLNTVVGRGALSSATFGGYNTVVGANALGFKTSGNNNVAIGLFAGVNNLTGSGNIFLGASAGTDETGSDKLYIDNTGSPSPLVYGDFATDLLRVNGSLQIGTAYKFPTDAGINGYVMQTDGDGNISWVNPASFGGGSSSWAVNGNNQYSSATGNVGIGTALPDAKFHVQGQIKIADGTQGEGKVLTSDANGLASWVTPSGGGGGGDFVDLTTDQYIGGNKTFTGNINFDKNIRIAGMSVGQGAVSGAFNTAMGNNSLAAVTSGTSNAAVGYNSLASNTTGAANAAFGYNALNSNVAGMRNVATGHYALYNNNGNDNVGIGNFALFNAGSTNNNVGLGSAALSQLGSGNNNVAIGYNVLSSSATGANNVAVGYQAGLNNTAGSANIFLGAGAGSNETGSNKLYIENSNSASPLVYGDFSTDLLRVNGSLQIGTAYKFPTVAGANGYVMQTDGSGNLSWVNPASFGGFGFVDLTTNQTVAGNKTFSGTTILGKDASINNVTVGRGNNNDATNTAVGNTALQANATQYNTGVGYQSLMATNSGNNNTAAGASALSSNTSGSFNTGMGRSALGNNTDGSQNTAFGVFALNANTSGLGNTAIGYSANVGTGNLENATAIGNGALVNASNAVQIGNDFVTAVTTSGKVTAWGGFATPGGTSAQALMADGSVSSLSDFMDLGSTQTATGSKTFANAITAASFVKAGGSSTEALMADGSVSAFPSLSGLMNLTTNQTAAGNKTFSGITTLTQDATINNITVGMGNGSATGNTAVGLSALQANTSAMYNTALGYQALVFATTGGGNTALGATAMLGNTSGYSNTAVGQSAFYSNSSGFSNTAVGTAALYANTTGNSNTAIGTYSDVSSGNLQNATAIGYFAKVGADNTIQLGNTNVTSVNTSGTMTASGFAIPGGTATQALMANGTVASFPSFSGLMDLNTDQLANGNKTFLGSTVFSNNIQVNGIKVGQGFAGSENTAVGKNALNVNTGTFNTAVGSEALIASTSSFGNAAVGYQALGGNSTGSENVAMGFLALNTSNAAANTSIGAWSMGNNSSGANNVAVGNHALSNNGAGNNNTAIGYYALNTNATGSNNTALGSNADITNNSSNSTAIGNGATATVNNKIRLGNASVTVIEGQVAYTFPSDGRFKTNIKETDVKGLDFIMKLKPVVYNFDTRRFEEFLTDGMDAATKRKHFERVDFKSSTAVRQSGFVAQDVEKAMKETGYNFNGVNIPKNEKDHYSVAYELFVVPLVKGMQEQQAEITSLKKQNEQLAAENAAFKADLEKIKEKLGISLVTGTK